MFTLFVFIIVLSLLVFVHEAGHFFVAKWCKMKVEEFGFGFPPKIWGIKKGETEFTINWIPLGGFVRIKGESGEFANDNDSFASKPAWQRFLVLIAGVVMNVVLAGVLFSFGFMIGLPSIIDAELPRGAHVRDVSTQIITVVSNSPAERAGFVVGDSLMHIDGQEIAGTMETLQYISEHGSNGIDVEVRRKVDGKEELKTLHVTSEYLEVIGGEGIGIGFEQVGIVSFSPPRAIWHGFIAAFTFTYVIARAFWDIIVVAITQQRLGVELSGPVGIAVLTGQEAARGFSYLIQFAATLSINLAIINILPIPVMDGGRILFLFIEKIRGKKADQRIEGMVHMAGFIFLMLLVVFVTYKDLVKYGGGIWGSITGIFG